MFRRSYVALRDSFASFEPRYREYKEWLRRYFNPDEFDMEEINRLLADPEMWD
jgi:hypothetical protein